MIIRPRTAQDLDACVSLAAELVTLDRYPPRWPFGMTMPEFVCSPNELAAWVADDAGVIVAHVALHRADGDPLTDVACAASGLSADDLAVLARLFVAPGARRQGVATALIDTAMAEGARRDQRLVLDVATHFSAAVALYEARGWTRSGSMTLDLPGQPPLDLWVFVGPHRRGQRQ